MLSRNEELPLAVDIRQTEERLHVLDGLVMAVRDPRAVLEAVLASEDPDAARALLRERLGLSEVQAHAALDMQFRRVSKLDRRKLEEHRDEVRAHLAYLTSLDVPSG